MRSLSLRWRITLWAALFTAAALVTFGVVVLFDVYSQQVETIDAQLSTEAGLVLGNRAVDTARLQADLVRLTDLPRDEFSLRGYAIGRAGRLVVARPAALAALMPTAPPGRRFYSRKIGGHWRRIGVFSRAGTTLLLATSLHRAQDSVTDLLGAYGIALPLVLLVVAGGSWWISGRALAPVVAITEAAAHIGASRLDERLPATPANDEIGRHIEVLNGMLERLQRSFEQANRFTADAAHELRTPLTIMRGQLEDAVQSGRLQPEPERLLVGLLEETVGLQRISDNLLLLARFDAAKNPIEVAAVDLSALIAEAAEDAELLAAPKGIGIEGRIGPGITVNGDRTMLRRVALNLVDNAVKFNRADGRLQLQLATAGDEAVLTVGNTGPGIPPGRRAALFERFYRVTTDRNRETGGSGLGLSLCREIVGAHGGRIVLDRSDDDWTQFSVHLPLPAAGSRAGA